VRAALAAGEPSVNHMEQIALDMSSLLRSVFPELRASAPRLCRGGLVSRMRTGGKVLFEAYGPGAWGIAAQCASDTVRGWGAMAIGAAEELSLAGRLALIRPFADDPHFAVREWAWLSVRPHIVRDPCGAIAALCSWTGDPSPRVRRFASEATRPRGVWSAHIPVLKQTPQLGLPVLEPLFEDPSVYVQNSVGNWLNDASRTSPQWVVQTCERLVAGESEATTRIRRRALRTLRAAA